MPLDEKLGVAVDPNHRGFILIGEAFMKAPDIGAKMREILGPGDYSI